MELTAVIMAAGAGKRMHSSIPKVLHKVCGVELVRHAMRACAFCGRPVVVIGSGAQQVRQTLGNAADYALQAEQLGTGHAVKMAAEYLKGKKGYTLVLAGDMPLLQEDTLKALVELAQREHSAAAVLTAELDDPTGYGRILRRTDGAVSAIVEHRDAREEQRAVKEVNSSVYCFETEALLNTLDRIGNQNDQKEYYLTDCIGLLVGDGRRVSALKAPAEECMGVNDQIQLAACGKILQRRINQAHMRAGVTIIDPETAYIGAMVQIGAGALIYPGNVLEGRTVIGTGAVLYPGNFLRDTTVLPGRKVGPNAVLLGQMSGTERIL